MSGDLGGLAPGSPDWARRLNELRDLDLTPRRTELIRLSEAVRGVLHRLVQTSAPVDLIAEAADQVEAVAALLGYGGTASTRVTLGADVRRVRRVGQRGGALRLLRPQPDARPSQPAGPAD